MNPQTLYDMELHDIIRDEEKGVGILRVVGGWIYWSIDVDDGQGVFVPDQIKLDTSLRRRYI